jgi:hypothetical protein
MMARKHTKPNPDAGSVRSHTRPTTRRKRWYSRDIDTREWLVRGALRRDIRAIPSIDDDVLARVRWCRSFAAPNINGITLY